VKSLAVFVRPKPVEPALETLLARARTEQVPGLTA
jgi:hypothetical protein